jgi:hypothetical protein
MRRIDNRSNLKVTALRKVEGYVKDKIYSVVRKHR